jgi:hypothetical protein
MVAVQETDRPSGLASMCRAGVGLPAAGNKYGVPNGTKLRQLWLKMRFLCERNHGDFPSKEHLAGTRKRSIMLNLVPLYGVPGIAREEEDNV